MTFLEKMDRGIEIFSDVDFSKELGLDAAWDSTSEFTVNSWNNLANFIDDQVQEFEVFADVQSRQFSKNVQSASRYVLGDGFTVYSSGGIGFHYLLSSATATINKDSRSKLTTVVVIQPSSPKLQKARIWGSC